MSYETLCETLDELPQEKRIETIDDKIRRLTPEQIKHLCDQSLNEDEKEALAACKTEAEREDRINVYARARFFRQCHWRMYLNGEMKEPPVQ